MIKRVLWALQEAALQLAAQAVANSDHEFGLELCKRAGSVIYDPRICSMMGECERPSDRPPPPRARARAYIHSDARTHAQPAHCQNTSMRCVLLLLLPTALILSSGAGYEIKGDALEAICAYRAAITMDTSVTGQALPPEVLPPARVCACTQIVQSKHTPDPCKRTRAHTHIHIHTY
jgi:hypothetical protein